jgi:hypothetical protein
MQYPASIIYVVIISDHVLPSFSALVSQPTTPERVLLIASQQFKLTALRFEQQLNALDPSIQVDRLDKAKLSGESMHEMMQWIESEFLPYYQQYQTHRWILNVTGGTKIMPMALELAIDWHEVHYKSFKVNSLQRWQLVNQKRALLPDLVMQDVPIKAALSLYTEITTPRVNRISNESNALPMAQQLWDAYSSSAHIHHDLSRVLTHYWVEEREQHQQASIEIPWSSFETKDIDALMAWCKHLAQLSLGTMLVSEQSLLLPGNKPKKSVHKDFKKWISGDWLENLVESWLDDAGIVYESNVPIKDSDRELDFVTLKSGQLQVVEVKTAPARNEALNGIVRQITSIIAVGKLTNYLFVGPEFKPSINNEDKWQAFEAQCQANRIKLIFSREELIAALR